MSKPEVLAEELQTFPLMYPVVLELSDTLIEMSKTQ